jgi:hypothetical protein
MFLSPFIDKNIITDGCVFGEYFFRETLFFTCERDSSEVTISHYPGKKEWEKECGVVIDSLKTELYNNVYAMKASLVQFWS